MQPPLSQTATDNLPSPEAHVNELAIAPLLELHDANSESGLDAALGDGFLCRSLPAYARIRNLATAYGIRFSHRQSPTVDGYRAWSYLWIPFLVEEKLLPFTDNVTALRKVVEYKPDLSLRRDCLRQTLAQNNLQHETAHVLAHLMLNASDFRETYADLDPDILCTGLSEALAVATGVLCAADVAVGDEAANEIYALNGLPLNGDFLEDLRAAERQLGRRRLFELTAMGAAYRALDAPNFKDIIHTDFIGAQTDKAIAHYSQWGLLLGHNSTNFSISTIGDGYLHLHGQAQQLASVQAQLCSRSASWHALVDGIERLRDEFFGERSA